MNCYADITDASLHASHLDVSGDEEAIARPVYLPGYMSWEHAVEHHDALTDIFSLGLLLASLATGLDFGDQDELDAFVRSRGNIFALVPHLHPVVGAAIVRMTALDRHERPQDLAALIARLEHYREQGADATLDFLADEQFRTATPTGKRAIILTHLRDRLFEISRRNRLVYFRPTMQTLDLTEASVPLMLDHTRIRPEQLLYYHADMAGTLRKAHEINLGKYLRFEDAPYLSGVLDRIRQEAVRDRKEFGCAQLRLALVFLRWHNLKDVAEERIHSPLLLLPVELTRKKGVRDTYHLQPVGTVAEVNPALRFHLKELYDLDLPDAIDLAETTVEAFYAHLAERITASEPGITLKKIDQPQIQLIYESARQRLNAYRRRMRISGRRGRINADCPYSYTPSDYRPLGVQLFQRKVRPSASPFDHLVQGTIAPRHPFIMPGAGPETVKTRTSYSLRTGSETNPYVWDFDLCSVTLGNFNYRKMTLVRDYARLLERDTANPAFDAVFYLQPRESAPESPEPPLRDLHLIVPSDPTQVSAIASARSGRSYIIQGPPGTGKSQTITNLIADYVARGKRVLFVCEKRAAIDVVYHRLRQQGLDALAVLIHDSQADKKEFIADLKVGYEAIQASGCAADMAEAHATAVAEIERNLTVLGHFSASMCATPQQAGRPLRHLMHRLVELRTSLRALSPTDQEMLPPYQAWVAHGAVVARLAETLREMGEAPVFAQHPLRHLCQEAILADRPLALVQTHLAHAKGRLAQVETTLAAAGLPLAEWDALGALTALTEYAALVQDLARRELLYLLKPGTKEARDLDRLSADHASRLKKLDKARDKTAHWM